MKRILVAVDDSPAGLAALRAAVRTARTAGARVRAIHVLTDGVLLRELERGRPPGGGQARERQDRGSVAVLRHAVDLGASAGVEVEAITLHGEPARAILHEARSWSADLIVVGRAGPGHVGQPYVGTQVRNVLEFTEVPVLVVP